MLGYEPKLFKKVLRGNALPEEVAQYLTRTATGWGGLYYIDQMVYDRVDFNSMELVEADGNRKRLSGREPIPTALFFLAVLHGDVDKATAALRYSSIPGARLLLGEGGLLGKFTYQFAEGAKQGRLPTRQLVNESVDSVNRAMPGQAVLSALKTVIDPTVREGIGANLPGLSLLKEPVINLATGKPLEPRQRLFGIEFPSIGGTPIPGATRIMEPASKLLSRYGLLTYRGPRSPIAGYPASEAPQTARREWEIEFGKTRNQIFSKVIPSIERAEQRASPEQLKPGGRFYEGMRERIQSYDSIAARRATAIINQRYRTRGKLPRQPTVRERRLGDRTYQQPPEFAPGP
jgi:hypothetical protein